MTWSVFITAAAALALMTMPVQAETCSVDGSGHGKAAKRGDRLCGVTQLEAAVLVGRYLAANGFIDESGYSISNQMRAQFSDWRSWVGLPAKSAWPGCAAPGVVSAFSATQDDHDFVTIWECIKERDPEAVKLEKD